MSFCPFPKDGDAGRESSGDAAALRLARETAASREDQCFPEDPQALTGEAHGEPGPAMYQGLRKQALQQAKRDQELRTRETILSEREASLLTRTARVDAREAGLRDGRTAQDRERAELAAEKRDFRQEVAAFAETQSRWREGYWIAVGLTTGVALVVVVLLALEWQRLGRLVLGGHG